jgi:hypothetical protein
MTLAELVAQAQKMIDEYPEAAKNEVMVSPRGDLRVNPVTEMYRIFAVDGIDDSPDIFGDGCVCLLSSELESVLRRCKRCGKSYMPVRTCYCRDAYTSKDT